MRRSAIWTAWTVLAAPSGTRTSAWRRCEAVISPARMTAVGRHTFHRSSHQSTGTSRYRVSSAHVAIARRKRPSERAADLGTNGRGATAAAVARFIWDVERTLLCRWRAGRRVRQYGPDPAGTDQIDRGGMRVARPPHGATTDRGCRTTRRRGAPPAPPS